MTSWGTCFATRVTNQLFSISRNSPQIFSVRKLNFLRNADYHKHIFRPHTKYGGKVMLSRVFVWSRGVGGICLWREGVCMQTKIRSTGGRYASY